MKFNPATHAVLLQQLQEAQAIYDPRPSHWVVNLYHPKYKTECARARAIAQ